MFKTLNPIRYAIFFLPNVQDISILPEAKLLSAVLSQYYQITSLLLPEIYQRKKSLFNDRPLMSIDLGTYFC